MEYFYIVPLFAAICCVVYLVGMTFAAEIGIGLAIFVESLEERFKNWRDSLRG